jgi:MFS family permease
VRRWFRGRLWRDRDFGRLWFSQTVDLFGGQVIDLALPTLAILVLHASPAQVGVLVGLEFVGFPTLGLIAGVWADRLRRRPIMIAANVGPLLAYGSLPVAFLFHALTIGQLYAVALVASCFNVFYEVAYQSYLPSLVDRRDLVEANQKLEVSHSASHTVGPGIGGLIIQWLGPAWAMVTTMITLVVSTVALFLIRRPESIKRGLPGEPALSRAFWSELREGIRVVTRNPIIRGLTACDATAALGINMLLAVWLVFAYRRLHITPAQVGLVLTVGALGFVPGALTATIIPRRLGLGRALILSPLISGLGVLVVAAAALGAPLLVLAIAWLLIYTPAPLFDINQISLRQAVTAHELQGRMNATVHTAVWSAAPVGAVIGGLLGSTIGVVQTIPIAAAVCLAAPLWLLFGPVRALRAHPEPALDVSTG